MRTGASPLQQSLTPESATTVKQAITLAKRRGHAQVTPLHVANAMLSSPTGLLRTACIQSHSHPLQCKALELCFNVALNRLPASASTPMLTSHNNHHHQPLLSNALVAAFKRAQAHQRRGSIENQQQPLLAIKIEIEQLIISILDDPSVSRVMREAGFSSTQVKTNVEKTITFEITSTTSLSKPKEDNLFLKVGKNQLNFGISSSSFSGLDHVSNEDVMSVVENLMNKSRRRSTVIVGECLVSSESVLRGVMAKIDKGDVPELLRNVQFINLPLFSFGYLSKEEVEKRLGELRCLLKSCVGRGVVLYLGDLKWIAEFRANCNEKVRKWYCPVEHITMEIGRLVSGIAENGRLWVMGIASYQTYMRCKLGHPSLETILGFQPLTIPTNSLGLSLNLESDVQGQLRSKNSGDGPGWPLIEDTAEEQPGCCSDCLAKFEIEARSLKNSNNQESNLPSWLQRYKDENRRLASNDLITELCKKWNSICNSIHKQHLSTEITLNFPSISPSSSLCSSDQSLEHNLKLALHYNSNQNSVTSSENMEIEIPRFKQFSAEGLKCLCNALEEKVEWQRIIIPEIASTVLQCRSGMTRRKGVKEIKEDTCLLFQGGDSDGKEKIARELAKMVFGTETRLILIGVSCYSSAQTDPNEEFGRKRRREEEPSSSYFEKFSEAISRNPHSVVLMEDIDQVDCYSQMRIKRAIERGRVSDCEGNEVGFGDAIVVLSCECLDSRSRGCSPLVKQKLEMTQEKDGELREEGTPPCVSLDLNVCVEDNESVEVRSSFEVELMNIVDGSFFFKVKEVL